MKVAGCRLQSSALGSAYSDTAVTSCSRHSQYVSSEVMNCNKLKNSSLSL